MAVNGQLTTLRFFKDQNMQTPIRNGASKSILIADGIRASSLRTPHKTAITESSRSLTYRQLIDRIDRVSNLAHAGWGLRHGDRAALMMRNRLEYMELVCGLSSAGVAVATIGPASAMPEVRFLCEDAGAGEGSTAQRRPVQRNAAGAYFQVQLQLAQHRVTGGRHGRLHP